jgi:hypothetical protein
MPPRQQRARLPRVFADAAMLALHYAVLLR